MWKLILTKDTKVSKQDSYRCISSKRKTTENVGLLLNGTVSLGQMTEKAGEVPCHI